MKTKLVALVLLYLMTGTAMAFRSIPARKF
jgi:hypothetical protein